MLNGQNPVCNISAAKKPKTRSKKGAVARFVSVYRKMGVVILENISLMLPIFATLRIPSKATGAMLITENASRFAAFIMIAVWHIICGYFES